MSHRDGLAGRYADLLVSNSRVVVVVLCLVTLAVGAGVLVSDTEFRVAQFKVDSEERAADETIRSQFRTEERTYSQVVVRSNEQINDTVLQEHLLETLSLQRDIRSNETIAGTLADEQPTMGVGNAIAIASDPRIGFDGPPPIDSQIRVLESRSNRLNKHVLGVLLDDPSLTPEGQPPVSALLEKGYVPGTDTADARLIVVVHEEDATDAQLLEAQRAIETLAEEHVSADTFVFGQQLAFERGATATGESFRLIGPLLVVVVFGLLVVAYRDLLDVLLSGFGIALVLLWTAGLVGWLGIEFTQLLVAVPCLLVGLSLDYSFHVVMRYRETRDIEPSARQAMAWSLAAVVLALTATTVTTAAGFLSGLFSRIDLLGDFGLAAAVGVLSALVVFGAFVPALKVELSGDRRGSPRRSVGSFVPISAPLSHPAGVAERAPVVVLGVALVLAAGGAFAATDVDTSTERTDFLPEQPPAWMDNLPAELRPNDNGVRSEAIFIEETFARPFDPTVDILVGGNVTDPSTLERIHEAEQVANESSVTVRPVTGGETVRSPLDAIEAAAEENDGAAAVVDGADTDGDGVPDRNLERVYDAAFAADPETARATINRTDDGEYRAVRMIVTVDENASGANVTRELRGSAAVVDGSPAHGAIATGGPILAYLQERAVLETVLASLLLTLAVIVAVLTLFFRRVHGSWTLGVVTLAPVLLSVPWLVGTMSLLSIPFNAETALLTAIAIGLGTDYTIHVSERFVQERRDTPRREALRTTLAETGGVVLASAATTAAGFAVLLLTVVPSLQRFGFVTALAVMYAFVASLAVLPSLLVLWDRYANRHGVERNESEQNK